MQKQYYTFNVESTGNFQEIPIGKLRVLGVLDPEEQAECLYMYKSCMIIAHTNSRGMDKLLQIFTEYGFIARVYSDDELLRDGHLYSYANPQKYVLVKSANGYHVGNRKGGILVVADGNVAEMQVLINTLIRKGAIILSHEEYGELIKPWNEWLIGKIKSFITKFNLALSRARG